jgi:tellurite methyltransferase
LTENLHHCSEKQETSQAIMPRQLWDSRYATFSPEYRLEPIPFVVSSLSNLAVEGWALDVAAGAGRHSLELARRGWLVDAVDISLQGLYLAQQRATRADLASKINFVAADIESPWLPCRHYSLILVSFFLYRPLFPLIKDRLLPGGWLIYETFTLDRLNDVSRKNAPDRQPIRRELLLEYNELRAIFSNFEILFYDEGVHNGRATAQLLARKPV